MEVTKCQLKENGQKRSAKSVISGKKSEEKKAMHFSCSLKRLLPQHTIGPIRKIQKVTQFKTLALIQTTFQRKFSCMILVLQPPKQQQQKTKTKTK